MNKLSLRGGLILALAAFLASGCTTLTDLKTDISERLLGRDNPNPPAALVEFKPTLQPGIIWNARVGASENYDFSPAVQSGAVYTASTEGDITKLDAIQGNIVWRIKAKEKLSGGVGLGQNLLLVGSVKGNVLAYDLNGNFLWQAKVSSEVLSAPRATDAVVIVRAGDSRIFGLDIADGKRKWVYERATPALSLRSSAGIVVDEGVVYAGFAGGKLIAVRVDDGKVIWESTVAQPKGTTEIERIADITSLPVVDGAMVYAVAYQGKVAAVDRASGRVVWNRDISSYTGMCAADGKVYIAHATGAVYALDYASGKTFWRQGGLSQRNLSAPLALGNSIVVGDVQGYLHFMDREDGAFSARLLTEDSPILPQIVELGSSGFVVQTRNGGLYAISLK
ncbi:MAG: outer membrane protein assembly factor BamB [Methylophilaceae bacterium]